MPPVRWKILYVTALTIAHILLIADGQHMQDAVSMSSDGWRPIIGTRRQPPGLDQEMRASEITQYKNPSQNVDVEIIKAETPTFPSTTAAPQKLPTKVRDSSADSNNNNINGGFFQQGGKIPPHAKLTSPGPYHTIPSSAHGPHIPIGASPSRPGQFGKIQKRPQNKPTPPYYTKPIIRKPVRGQVAAHSTRDEVFVRPPNSVPFTFPKPGPNNVKTRETQGLGLFGSNHFQISQQGSHDFSNKFVLPPPSDTFQQFKGHPVTYIFSKPLPQGNEIRYQFKSQNDEYTRNLVPPPLAVFQQDDGNLKPNKVVSKNQENFAASTEPIIGLSDFSNSIQSIHQFGVKTPNLQENVVPQLAPPLEQNFSFQKQFNKSKEQSVDVQVTREKLKAFHNIPSNFNPSAPDYVDYDFHTLKKPTNLPKLQTYEVTEGKWIDSPNPYTFSFANSQQILPQRLTKTPSARPQLIAEPVVELDVPPFLPTPYKPTGVVPTSPTQSEVSTIFSQISKKMNRYKNEALTTNPLFFDVKEVSTHYPIFGKPEPITDSTTSSPLQMDVNGEISNEITTRKQLQMADLVATIIPVTNKTPQRTKIRRRRPQPRRPSTITTTTTTSTTEEPPLTENYELQRTEENFEEVSVETEKPQRKIRPRPNRYRTTTPSYENEEVTEKRIRGRNRYKQRGRGGNEVRPSSVRKRVRPNQTDTPSNYKMTQAEVSPMSTDTTEGFIEQVPSTEHETQGLFETKYTQASAQSSYEEVVTKPSRLKYELPKRHHEPTQYEEEIKYETTIVNSELNSVHQSSYEDSDQGITEDDINEKAQSPISNIGEQDNMANIELPENEVDFSTMASMEQNEDRIQTTLATTLPTTTTSEATTIKSHRIRRPTKYDSSNRPRFSVKEYRQRLNQYTSTPSTTTDFVKTTSEGGIRLKFPNRLRTRLTTRTTTQQSNQIEEDQTESTIRRGGFKPKEPRHSTTTTENPQENIITEKNIKSVNTRLRPFGRYKTTTESTSLTPKVSIKPNLFSARRRPPQLGLRTRLFNKLNKTEETTTYENEVETTDTTTVEPIETEDDNIVTETSTELNLSKPKNIETTTASELTTDSTTLNLNEDDYSQRVSELTSSFKNQYETPGLFKSVAPISRRIPNYFTISTDDPILPIEAFFPNIKEKDKDQK